MKKFEREDELEQLNRTALRIARSVADENGKLMAGNVSNTPLYKPNDKETDKIITEMFRVRSSQMQRTLVTATAFVPKAIGI